MRIAGFLVIAALVLAACGRGGDRARSGGGVSFASGPIASACLRSDRKAANRQVCRCIQSVADRELRGGDQRLAVRFYGDPHRAQEVKMSKRPSDDAFWDRYKRYAEVAERTCRGL
ncbi:MAG: hypothetical protein QNJ09_08945 [Paracoccaceae bacterium]|nr:hypothetical protein [Paracoccaceae bacterium]